MLQGQLRELGYDIETTAAQPDGLFRNPSDFWSALDNQLKPSINYVVTLPLDLDVVYKAAIVKTTFARFKPPDTEAEEVVQVTGTIFAKGHKDEFIAGAKVVVRENGMTAETDNQGQFAFAHLPRGKFTFEVMVSGKKVKEISVSIPSKNYDLEV